MTPPWQHSAWHSAKHWPAKARLSSSPSTLAQASPSLWTPGARTSWIQHPRRRPAPQPWKGMRSEEQSSWRERANLHKSKRRFQLTRNQPVSLQLSYVTSVIIISTRRPVWRFTKENHISFHQLRGSGTHPQHLPCPCPLSRTTAGLYHAICVVRECHLSTLVMSMSRAVWILLCFRLSRVTFARILSTPRKILKITTVSSILISVLIVMLVSHPNIAFFAPTLFNIENTVTCRSIWPGESSYLFVNYNIICTVLPCHQNKNHLLTYCKRESGHFVRPALHTLEDPPFLCSRYFLCSMCSLWIFVFNCSVWV